MQIPSTNPSSTCYECQVGHVHKQNVTFFTWLGDELITVPNFPAWVCDFCGRREYDPLAVNRLSLLLNPNAGKPSSPPPSKPARPNTKGHRINLE